MQNKYEFHKRSYRVQQINIDSCRFFCLHWSLRIAIYKRIQETSPHNKQVTQSLFNEQNKNPFLQTEYTKHTLVNNNKQTKHSTSLNLAKSN